MLRLFYLMFLLGVQFIFAKQKNANYFLKNCKDRFVECADHLDDCTVSPGWMTINCPKSCKTCHLQDPKVRCNASFLSVSTVPVVKKGDFDVIFNNLVNKHGFQVISSNPWILEYDNFLSGTDIDEMIAQVGDRWEKSHESGEISATGEGNKVFS